MTTTSSRVRSVARAGARIDSFHGVRPGMECGQDTPAWQVSLMVERLPSTSRNSRRSLERVSGKSRLSSSLVTCCEEGQLRIELRGNLAAMLTAAQQRKKERVTRNGRPSRAGSIGCGGGDLNPRPLGYEPLGSLNSVNVFGLCQPTLPAATEKLFLFFFLFENELIGLLEDAAHFISRDRFHALMRAAAMPGTQPRVPSTTPSRCRACRRIERPSQTRR
jgi:hypothetical protein